MRKIFGFDKGHKDLSFLEVDFLSATPATIDQLRAAYVIQNMFQRKACGLTSKKKNIDFWILLLGILVII